MTYPNGRVLDYNYASGLDDAISRLSSISGATTPTYDANGNTTKNETGKTYEYDA